MYESWSTNTALPQKMLLHRNFFFHRKSWCSFNTFSSSILKTQNHQSMYPCCRQKNKHHLHPDLNSHQTRIQIFKNVDIGSITSHSHPPFSKNHLHSHPPIQRIIVCRTFEFILNRFEYFVDYWSFISKVRIIRKTLHNNQKF